MSKKPFSITQRLVVLVSVLMIGFLSMPNHMSVFTMHMEQHRVSVLDIFPNSAAHGHENSHHALSYAACSPFCVFIVFQSVSAIPYGDKIRIADLDFVVQSIFIKSVTPPPKV
jgi:hypothetical protein